MASKTEKVLIGVAVGTVVGGIAGFIIGRQPPFTLPPDSTDLDKADQALATGAGAVFGELIGAFIALST